MDGSVFTLVKSLTSLGKTVTGCNLGNSNWTQERKKAFQ